MTAENSPAVPLGKQPTPVRASDADRDRIADILRDALAEGRLDPEEHAERVEAVYRAKTLAELEPLISDLPAGQQAMAPPQQAVFGAQPAPQLPGKGYARHYAKNVVAVLSGATRQGRWRVGPKVNAVAICGGVELDFTQAIFDCPQVVVNVSAICGGVEIKVPENVSLRSAGSGIMGGFEVEEQESPQPNAPVLVIKGVAIWGGVDAKPVLGRRVRDLSDD